MKRKHCFSLPYFKKLRVISYMMKMHLKVFIFLLKYLSINVLILVNIQWSWWFASLFTVRKALSLEGKCYMISIFVCVFYKLTWYSFIFQNSVTYTVKYEYIYLILCLQLLLYHFWFSPLPSVLFFIDSILSWVSTKYMCMHVWLPPVRRHT